MKVAEVMSVKLMVVEIEVAVAAMLLMMVEIEVAVAAMLLMMVEIDVVAAMLLMAKSSGNRHTLAIGWILTGVGDR
ncbi:unnamed protein product [Lampetra fluviatilis]